MAFEVKRYPDWSWSLSRENTYNECPRKYYFQYYASHNGWLKESDEFATKAYQLKHLQNLYLLLGESIHDVCASVVQNIVNKETPDEEMLIKKIKGVLNRAYLDSKNKIEWSKKVKIRKMLHEIYYQNRLPERRVEQIKERIDRCCGNLLGSNTLTDLMENRQIEIIEIEQLNYFMIENTKIYVKIDLLLKVDNDYMIVDWKTGSENDFQKQLSIYALYLKEQYNVGTSQIKARLENLLKGDSTEHAFTDEDITSIRDEIKLSILRMQELVENQEINQPRPYETFEPSPRETKCSNCNFLEICDANQL
jgi:ATP-dependent exoDNAse (exonuclease V) beta subunit